MTTTTPPPSVAVMKLNKSEYIELCDKFRDKALADHQDMRAWMNRALLAESRLATLRAQYEPQESAALMSSETTDAPTQKDN